MEKHSKAHRVAYWKPQPGALNTCHQMPSMKRGKCEVEYFLGVLIMAVELLQWALDYLWAGLMFYHSMPGKVNQHRGGTVEWVCRNISGTHNCFGKRGPFIGDYLLLMQMVRILCCAVTPGQWSYVYVTGFGKVFQNTNTRSRRDSDLFSQRSVLNHNV